VALRPPRPEVCDGTDDDCDGEVDDDAPVQAGTAPPPLAAEWKDGAWPKTLAEGERGEAWLTFRNVGNVTWRRGEWSVRPEAVRGGGPSRLQPREGWPAVDAAAILAEDVAPGGLAVFRFPVQRSAGSGDVAERFTLVGPGGRAVACPAPTAELSVASTPAPQAAPGHASARPSSCAGGLLLPWAPLVLALRRRKRRGT
jgi:hypothetical protein